MRWVSLTSRQKLASSLEAQDDVMRMLANFDIELNELGVVKSGHNDLLDGV